MHHTTKSRNGHLKWMLKKERRNRRYRSIFVFFKATEDDGTLLERIRVRIPADLIESVTRESMGVCPCVCLCVTSSRGLLYMKREMLITVGKHLKHVWCVRTWGQDLKSWFWHTPHCSKLLSIHDIIKPILPIEVMVKLNTWTRKSRLEDPEGKRESIGVCLSAFLCVWQRYSRQNKISEHPYPAIQRILDNWNPGSRFTVTVDAPLSCL